MGAGAKMGEEGDDGQSRQGREVPGNNLVLDEC